MTPPDRDLGLRVHHVAGAGEPAFVVVRVQQAVRRPAVDVGGQLPAEVDAVEETGAECDARGGEQVGGIAGHEDPPVPVPLNLPRVEREARQPGRFSQWQIHAEHAADAVPELRHGHRLVVVVVGGLLLAREEPHELGVGRPESELTVLGACEAEADPAYPGDVDVSVLEHGHALGHGDTGEPLDLRIGGAGKRDVGQVTDAAAGPVAADQVSSGHPVGPVRAAHLGRHRVVVLTQPDDLVCAADVGAQLAGVVVQDAFEQRLRERQHLHRGIRERGEVHMHPAPRQPRGRPGSGASGFESLELAPVTQHFQDLPAETACLRDVSDLRLPLRYQRSHAGPAQLTGEHQTGRAGAHDDHIGVHHWPLLCLQVLASAGDHAARPGGCRKPQGVPYIGSGEGVVSFRPTARPACRAARPPSAPPG